MTDEARNLNLVRSILDNSTTTYFDNGKSTSASYEPNEAVTPLIGRAGSVDAGTHYYSFSVVTADGTESGMGQQKRLVTLSVPSKVNVTVPVSALASGAATKRRVYRTKAGAPQNTSDWFLVGSVTGNTLTVLEDNVPDAALSTRTVGARPGGQDFPNFAFAAMKATPGTTNGVIRYTWTPTEQRAHPYLIARKVSSETNTITLTQCAMTTYAQYDVAAEFSNGVSISGRSSEIEVKS